MIMACSAKLFVHLHKSVPFVVLFNYLIPAVSLCVRARACQCVRLRVNV